MFGMSRFSLISLQRMQREFFSLYETSSRAGRVHWLDSTRHHDLARLLPVRPGHIVAAA
jgi:hypothetical protein